MFKLFLFSILILRGLGKNRPVPSRGRVDALLVSLTKEQMLEIDEILQLRLVTGKDTEEEEAVDDFKILSHEHLSKEDLPPAVTNEELSSLAKLGFSKADIEEVRELSKVMITSKETAEISNFIKRASDDELMKMSEMSPGDLERLVEGKKSEPNTNLMNFNHKHLTRRDADPEPEPEPEPSPREQVPSFYHSYGRKKRSPRPGFKLKLRAKLGFGKSKKGRGGSLLRNQRRRRRHRLGGRGSHYGGRGGGSYGRRNEHRGSYGVEYEGYWRRKREAKDAVGHILNTLEQKQSSTKKGRLTAASLSHPRKKRFVMDSLMKMVGLKTEQEEPPEVVYMSAVMGGKKHQVGRVENHDDSFGPDSHDGYHHHHGTPSDQQGDTQHPPAYSPSESYKQAMARAKLVRLH